MTTATRATRLFTLRMWQEEADDEHVEWRGKVQALPEGEAYYFRDWSRLIARLEAMLAVEHVENTYSEPQQRGIT
jgi:hypothetical protein